MSSGEPIPIPGGSRARRFARGIARHSTRGREAFHAQAKDHRFYEIVEETLDCGFEHHYLLLEDRDRQSARRAAGLLRPAKSGRRRARLARRGRIGAADVSRASSPCACSWSAARRAKAISAFASRATKIGSRSRSTPRSAVYARRGRASLVVFKDFSARYRETLERFTDNGYTRIPSMPMTQLALRAFGVSRNTSRA